MSRIATGLRLAKDSLAVLKADAAVGAGFGVVAILAFIATCTMASALGVIFRVELYSYSTEGQVTGGFAQADIAAAFRPALRRRR